MSAEPPAPLTTAELRRRFLRRLLVGAAVVLVLGLVGAGLARGSAEAAAMLREARPGWILAGVAAWMVSVLGQGLRWRALVPGTRLPLGPALLWQIGASALAFGLPGPVGEAAAAAIARQRGGVAFSAAFAASVAARLLGLGLFGVAVLLLWPLVRGAEGAPAVMALGATGALGALGIGVFVGMFLPHPLARVGGRLARLLLGAARGEGIAARLEGLARSLESVASVGPARWAEALGWGVAAFGAQVLAMRLALAAVGAEPGWALTAWLHAMVSVAALAGVVLPAGEAASDAVFVAAYGSLGGVPLGAALVADAAMRAMRLGAIAVALPAAAWLLGAVGMAVGDDAR